MFRKVAVTAVGVLLLVLIGVVGTLRMSNPTVTVGSGAPTLIQAGPIVTTTGANPSGTLALPSAANSTLIAVVANATSGAPTVTAPANWTQWDQATESTRTSIQVWVYPINPGGISSVTFTGSATASPWYVHLSEWANLGSLAGPSGAALFPNVDATGFSTATSGTTLSLQTTANLFGTGDFLFAAWIQFLAAPATATFTSPGGFTRVMDNGASSLTQHLDIEYAVSSSGNVRAPTGSPFSTTLTSNQTTSSGAGVLLAFIPANPSLDETASLEYDSLTIKRNTFDFGLMLGGKYLLEDGSGFYLLEDSSGDYLLDTYVPQIGDPVAVTNPTWNGRVVSVHQSDLHNRVTNYQRVAVAATNITPAPRGTAPGDLSDTAGGGYYQLEDASGDYQLEDGSGLYVLEGTAFVYRNLSLQKSQNQDGTVTTYGSLETFEGAFAAGMSFNLTSTNFGISSQPYTITNVTTTFLHTTPVYTIEFGDAYQTLQTAGGGVLTQVGSQATIQQGAAVPAGLLGSVQVTANQGSITTAVDLTGLTVTVTVVSGRRIHVTGDVLLQSTVAGDTGWLAILEGATQLRSVQIPLSTSAGSYTARVRVLLTPSVGVHTYKLQAQRLAGTGVVTMVAASTDPATLIVEDIGV